MRPNTYVLALIHGDCCYNQSNMRTDIITIEKLSVWYQHKHNLTQNLQWTELLYSDFCSDNGSPDGRDV
jgi:hypothetical protein